MSSLAEAFWSFWRRPAKPWLVFYFYFNPRPLVSGNWVVVKAASR